MSGVADRLSSERVFTSLAETSDYVAPFAAEQQRAWRRTNGKREVN